MANTIIKGTNEITIDTTPMRKKMQKQFFCITNGKIYASATDAAKEIDCHISGVCYACNGKISSIKGKEVCWVDDLPKHILKLSQRITELEADAKAYQPIKAIKAEKERKLKALEDKIIKERKNLTEQLHVVQELKAEYAELSKELNLKGRCKHE